MKDWCKHSYGYVNFDDEFLYIASNRNWSKVDALGELNEDGYRSKSKSESQRGAAFLLLISLTIAALYWSGGFKAGLYVFVVIIGGFLAVFMRMSKSLSLKYKIPYSKVKSIEVKSRSAEIVFLDYHNKEESHEFRGLYSKGTELFMLVSDSYIPKGRSANELEENKWEV